MTSIHAVTFGDLETQTWGVSWTPAAGAPCRLAIRQGAAAAVREATLESEGDAWRLAGDGVTVLLRPVAQAARGRDIDGELEILEQLCELTGELELESRRTELRCLAWQSTLERERDLSSIDSFRFLAAWLDPRHGFSLTALRPGRARGHDSDLIAAAVIDDPPLPPVVDPRLSTTYGASGLPARAGVELWFQEPGESESEGSAPPEYPRRAA
jgi:hypothetical protein